MKDNQRKAMFAKQNKNIQKINLSESKPRSKYLSEDYYVKYKNKQTGKSVGVYNLTDKTKEVYAVGSVKGTFQNKESAEKKAIKLLNK